MLLGYTILYVEDVRHTLAFYEAAFGLKRRFLHESGDFGELDTGTTALAFSTRKLLAELGKNPSAPIADSPCFEIAFVTEDVPAALKKAVAAGATLVQEPEDMPWGQTTAYVRDPDGFLVELCTAVAM
ncbi:VOC family protein [Natronospirillum operosum]|uniref:VOC family protein n=1 Tax=Natronospirillum operosum TaxID=2759953 RepID=A0A4Z0WEA2_9GAMM|nr:VOC family protein [Natronospirillum operosum]TGG92473.1 VOC family protein [Natronospirillum operosum]